MASPLEKGLDFTLGVAVLTAETLEQVVTTLVERGKVAQENAPAVIEAILEKGRPARENLLRSLRDEVWQPIRGSGVPAALEIRALEERVAVLERQVSSAPSEQEPPEERSGDAPTQTSDAATTGADTATDAAPEPSPEDREA